MSTSVVLPDIYTSLDSTSHMANTRFEVAIRALDAMRFERLMCDLLDRQGYEVDPTGTSGPDGGREALLYDSERTGILHCSVRQDRWVEKAHTDAEKAVKNFDQEFDQFIFATTQDPAGTKRDRVEQELAEEWGMAAKVWDFARLRNELLGNRENHDLAREHLSVDPTRAHVDIESEVDSLYEELIDRVKRRKAPDGTSINDSALVVIHAIPQEAIEEHHDRYVEDLPHPPQFGKRDAYPDIRPKVKITTGGVATSDGEAVDRLTAIHRDGWTEGVLAAVTHPPDHRPGLIRKSIDAKIVSFVETALDHFDEADILPPVYVYVTVLDASDYKLDYPNKLGGPPGKERLFGKDEIQLNRVRIDSTDADVPEAMRRSLNQLWRHCGWNRSIHFDHVGKEDGEPVFEWRPRRR